MSPRKVVLEVREPSEIQLETWEIVRFDRIDTGAAVGTIIVDESTLLPTGASWLHLEAGTYQFRALRDVDLQIVSGGVHVVTRR